MYSGCKRAYIFRNEIPKSLALIESSISKLPFCPFLYWLVRSLYGGLPIIIIVSLSFIPYLDRDISIKEFSRITLTLGNKDETNLIELSSISVAIKLLE